MDPFEGKPQQVKGLWERIVDELLYRPKEHFEHKSLLREFVTAMVWITIFILGLSFAAVAILGVIAVGNLMFG